MDDDKRNFSRVDVAHVLVFMSSPLTLRTKMRVMLNETICMVRMVDEIVTRTNICRCNQMLGLERENSLGGSEVDMDVGLMMSGVLCK